MKTTLRLLLFAFVLTTAASGQGSSIVGWGSNGSGEIDVPGAVTNPVAIVAGLNSGLGLNANNSLAAWGATYSGPPMPTDLTNVVAIAGSAAHNVVIRSDGTAAAWGEGFPKSYVPGGLSNLVASAAGFEHSLVLRNDGTVYGWGGANGAWGVDDSGAHIVPDGLSNVIAIAAGGKISLALKADRTVAGWGQIAVPAGLNNVTAIAVGAYHALALKADGTVSVWGDNSVGQLNAPADLSNVVAIAAGWYHSVALKADGSLVSWGYNFAGQTDVPPGWSNVVGVASGYTHNLALVSTDAPSVFQSPLSLTVVVGDTVLFRGDASGAWPLKLQWQVNGMDLDSRTNSALLLTNIQLSQAGSYSIVASNALGTAQSTGALLTVLPFQFTSQPTNQTRYVGDDITVSVGLRGVGPFAYQWRSNGTDLVDQTNAVLVLRNVTTNTAGDYSVLVSNAYGSLESSPATITILDSAPFALSMPVSVVTWPGATATFQIVAEGTKPLYYQWRFNGVPLEDATNATLTLSGVSTNEAGYYSVTVSNVLDSFSTANLTLSLVPVAAWGSAIGNVTNLAASLSNVVAVAAGGGTHALGLKPDGTVLSWGLITTVPSSVTNVSAIAASSQQSLALRSNGTVVAWNTLTTVPASATNVASIAAGGYPGRVACFVVKSNGTVQAWASGPNGITNVPAGLSGILEIAAGGYHALALRSDGLVQQWADSLDNNATAVPTNVTDVISLSARGQHSVALKADGTVAAWGRNTYGENSVPPALSNVVDVAASEENNLALKQDGTVVVWGRNNYGQTNIAPGVSNVVQIDGGPDYNLVRLGGTNLTIIRQPRAAIGLPLQQVLLSVGVVGREPFTVQWQLNGTNVPGATNLVWRVAPLSKSNLGMYRAWLTTSSGTLTTAQAQVSMSGSSVVAWGSNTFGQTNVPPRLSAVAAAGGSGHSLALRPDGTVAAWGASSYSVTNVPASATNLTAVAAGTRHNLALRSDRRVVAWGDATYGKTTVPGSVNNAVGIAAGDTFSLALKSDGLTTQWGNLPSPPVSLSNVVSVAAGYSHALALRANGTVVTWGSGAPAVPSNLSNVVAVAGGNLFSLALTTNGTVRAWGDNSYGQTAVPADLSNVVAIAAGGYAALVLKGDGTLVSWGRDASGLTNPPAGLSNIVGIAGGDLHSLAVVGSSDGPTIVRQPAPYYTNISGSLLLSVGAVSTQPLSYQWLTNGTPLPGATNSWLFLPLPQTNNSGNYAVVVSNSLGVVVSSNAAISVLSRPPFFVTEPAGQTNVGGGPLTLSAVLGGTSPMTYRWSKDGFELAGATSSVLLFNPATRSNSGVYQLIASNVFGSALSSNAVLRVMMPQVLQAPVLTDGAAGFSFGDSDGGALAANDAGQFSVQSSTNLVDWQTLPGALVLTNGTLWFQDTNAPAGPQRFYRALEKP